MRRITESREVELVTVEVTDEWKIELGLPGSDASVELSAELADRLGLALRAEAARLQTMTEEDRRARDERLALAGGVF